MDKTRLCINCGEPVGPGRSDKKYCSEACKSEYHNKEKEQTRKAEREEVSLPDYVKVIQDILIENRQILDKCLGSDDKRKMEKRDLDGLRFTFKYFTSQSVTIDGEVYNFCFDLGYKEVENGRVIIVRRKREVNG